MHAHYLARALRTNKIHDWVLMTSQGHLENIYLDITNCLDGVCISVSICSYFNCNATTYIHGMELYRVMLLVSFVSWTAACYSCTNIYTKS